MQKLSFNRTLYLVTLFLCLIALQTLILNAQIRPREKRDSAQAYSNGSWFIPANYQFEVQYPKLLVIPPLSTGMDFETLLAYIYLDSLMRSTNRDSVYKKYLTRWNKQRIKNDTIVWAVKYLYKLKDFDPMRFYQYMQSTSKPLYTLNLMFIKGTIVELLSKIVSGSPVKFAMNDLNCADYILKVHVNSVSSLPRIEYPNKGFIQDEFVYQVNATVLDTLKGKVFKNCSYIQSLNKKNLGENLLTTNSSICFSYVTGPYTNPDDGYIIDGSLLDSSGMIRFQPGQDLIVTLGHYNYLWDYSYDYFSLTLLSVYPIINGQVKDINHVWSKTILLDYSDWKNALLQKRDMLLNGGY